MKKNCKKTSHRWRKKNKKFPPFLEEISDKECMPHVMRNYHHILTSSAVALLLCNCSKEPNRWEAHKKERNDPNFPKFEAPFQQNRQITRDPYQPNQENLGKTTSEDPTVIEGERWNENKDPILYGIAITGKPGFVLSPYAPDKGLVDVRGYPTGTDVRDPYTWKIMKVPPLPENQSKEKEQTLKKPEDQMPEPIPEITNE